MRSKFPGIPDSYRLDPLGNRKVSYFGFDTQEKALQFRQWLILRTIIILIKNILSILTDRQSCTLS